MTIQVIKGQKVDVTKNRPDIKNVVVNINWQVKDRSKASLYEIDSAAFLLTMNGKTRDDKDFIFYNNPSGGNGAVQHSVDHDGGGEQITINLASLPQDINRIAFTITIHSADFKGQNFGQIENVTVAICDKDTQEVLLRYDPNAKILKGIQMKLVKRDFSNMMFIKRGSGTNGAT